VRTKLCTSAQVRLRSGRTHPEKTVDSAATTISHDEGEATMKKVERLFVRVSSDEAALLRATSRRLDTSLSEIIRRSALQFALASSQQAVTEDQHLAATA
jgi:hypothetical protein